MQNSNKGKRIYPSIFQPKVSRCEQDSNMRGEILNGFHIQRLNHRDTS